MFKKITSLLILFFFIQINTESFSYCPDKPIKKLGEHNALFLRKIKDVNLSAAQGVTIFNEGKEKKIALSSGYWRNNTSIFDYKTGNVLHKENLSIQKPSKLLASVLFHNDKLWWSSYREEKLYSTNLKLKSTESYSIPNLKYSVGLSASRELDQIFIINRNKKKFVAFKPSEPAKIKSINIKGLNHAPYDIDYYNKCLFFVESSHGKIWVINIDEVIKKKSNILLNYLPEVIEKIYDNYFLSIKPSLWFSDSKRIQHLDIYKDQLFVIDTDSFQIIQIYLNQNSYRKINLPTKHIFRGLAIPMEGKILLTGFETKDNLSENKTAIFEFSF